jgi:hypothetical protein
VKSEELQQLETRLPVIRRARGYRLYDYRGKRYLDLYQQGGAGLLGHRAGNLNNLLKDLLSRGLAGDLPSIYQKRLEKALLARFPGYREVRIAASFAQALELGSRCLGRTLSAEDIWDPLTSPAAGAAATEAACWRPLLPGADAQAEQAEVLFPLLPFSLGGAPACVCFKRPLPASFPVSSPLSPLILAGALRALNDLKRYAPAPWFRPDLLSDASGWTQQGVYLLSKSPREEYATIFLRFLEAGLLLSPCWPGPSILPAEASMGEVKRMLELFKKG